MEQKMDPTSSETLDQYIAHLQAGLAEKKTSISALDQMILAEEGAIAQSKLAISRISTEGRGITEEVELLTRRIAEPLRYRNGLLRFIERLRSLDAGNYGYEAIVAAFFDPEGTPPHIDEGGEMDDFIKSPPRLHGQFERSLTFDMKKEIVQSALAETGLTQEEAGVLVDKQYKKDMEELKKVEEDMKKRGMGPY